MQAQVFTHLSYCMLQLLRAERERAEPGAYKAIGSFRASEIADLPPRLRQLIEDHNVSDLVCSTLQ